jgi:hypothetical protein
LWGSEDHVRQLFDGSGVRLEFEREIVELQFGSVSEAVEFYATRFGPIVTARQRLEPEGRWPALRDDLWALFERHSASREGVVWPCEYLVVVGHKDGPAH